MESRSVILRILGDDRSGRAAIDWINVESDKIDARDPTLKIGADASGAMRTAAGLHGVVDELTSKMNSIKFSGTDTAFNATLASMLAKLQAFRTLADRPILSDKSMAQGRAGVLSLAASFDDLLAKQRAAAHKDSGGSFPLTGEKPGMQHGFGSGWLPFVGNLPSVSLFGGVAATSGLHILIDSAIELGAKLIPATIAVLAFGGALTALTPDILMMAQREQSMFVATNALQQSFPGLTTKLDKFGNMVPVAQGGLKALNQEFRPGLVQLWGDSLTVAAGGGGVLKQLLEMTVPWLDKWAAILTVDLTSNSGGFMKFIHQGAHDLGQFGALLAPVGSALKNLLAVANKTGIADDLMMGLTAGAKLLQLFSELPTPILVTLAALHGIYVWGGLATTGLAKIGGALGSIPGLGGLKALKDIPGTLDRVAAKGLEAGGALQFASVKGMRGLAIDAEGAEVKTGLLKTGLAVLSQVPIWGWVAAGAVAVGALIFAFGRGKDATQGWLDSLNKDLAGANNASVFNRLSSDVGQVNTKLAQTAKVADTASTSLGGSGRFGAAMSSVHPAAAQATQDLGRLGAEQSALTVKMSNFGTNVGYIMRTFGVSYPEALAIATRAGVKLTDNMQGNSKQAQDLRQQIFGLVGGLTQLQGPSGQAGRDFQALAFAGSQVTTNINQLNSAWHQWIGVVTGGESSFDTFAQGMVNLSTTGQKFSEKLGILTVKGTQAKAGIDDLSQSGINLNQAFMQQVGNADSLIASLRSQGASSDVVAKSTKAMVAQLLPFAAGSKEATAVLRALATEADYTGNGTFKDLAAWTGIKTPAALRVLKGELDKSTGAASILANTVDKLLTTDFQKFVYVNSGAQAALKKFTTDLLNNTETTRQGRSDRAHLISDLEKSGMSAKDATSLVDGLSRSLGKLPADAFVQVHEKGTGLFTITGPGILASQGKGGSGNAAGGLAAGGRIPGYGGGDKWPAMLEGGEAVVPKHLVAPIAPFLGSHGVPGFAAGGMVGSGSFGGSIAGLPGFTAGFHNTFVKDMTLSMESAMKSSMKNMMQAGMASKVPNVGSGVGRWAPLVKQALAMEGLNPFYILEVLYQMQTESGGNPNIFNTTDINAQHGTPSGGLMQVIMPTFLRWHWPGTSYNLLDPLANIAAALNYGAHGRGFGTGPGQIGSGHGYANGGIINEPIWGMGASGQRYTFGERGPEMVTPLSRRGNYSGGGGSGETAIHIIVNAGDAVDPNAVAKAIHERLRRYKAKKGGAPLGLD